LALYFNLNFQKEKIKEMFENDKIREHLYEKLLNYREFFKGLILPIKDVIKLIKKAKKYEHILTLLFYIGTDCSTFLEVVSETKESIYKFQEEEMNKNKDNELYDNKIDIEKYVEPKKGDDISEIFSKIEGLKSFTIMINEDMKLINYSSLIIEKYSEFYDKLNLDKLIILKDSVESIKFIDQTFIYKSNLEEKIHRTGLKLIKNGKIKNIKILEFIECDIYFIDINYNKKRYCPLENIYSPTMKIIIA
jgi:hypothetical protein